jgi:hypothetical protein
MSEISFKDILVLCDENSVIVEVRNPDGSFSRFVMTSEPSKQFCVREYGVSYRPEGTVLEKLLNPKDESQGAVACHVQAVVSSIMEIKGHLLGVYEIVSEKGSQVEEYERACAGD